MNLQLFCIPRISPRKSLDIWPALPLIKGHVFEASVDNVTVELKHGDRICQINLIFYTSQLEKLWTAINAGAIPGARSSVLWKLVDRASSS